MKRISMPGILLIMLSLLLSCTEESCEQDTEVFAHAGFYSSESSEQINIDSLDIFGLGIPDSSLYEMAVLDNISLPLNPSTLSCGFVIINGGRSDTIVLRYQPKLEFLSKACGYIYTFELEEVLFTTNDIFNISISINSVSPGDEENIQIFF